MMDEVTNNPPDRLDKLLRQWGAEQAVVAEEPHLASPPLPFAAAPRLFARLGPVLAAAGLMFALAGAIFFLARDERTLPVADRPDRPTPAVVAAERPHQSAEEIDRDRAIQVELAERDRWHKTLRDELAARHEKALAELQDQAAEYIVQLNQARTALAQAESKLETSAGDLARLTAEVARLRQAQAAAEQLATDQMAKFQSHLAGSRRAFRDQFQEVYLSGEVSLASRQRAARQNRLIARFAAVRQAITDAQTTRLVEMLEVWLTRLDQVDSGNDSQARRFARQLADERLAARIEQALATFAAAQPAVVRHWLLECELVFAGLDAAG